MWRPNTVEHQFSPDMCTLQRESAGFVVEGKSYFLIEIEHGMCNLVSTVQTTTE